MKMYPKNRELHKGLALGGVIGPVIYFFLMETLGRLWPGYSSIRNHMSELGGVESPYKGIMNIFGFMLVGLFILIFGVGYNNHFKKSWHKTLTVLSLVVGGLFMIVVGFFPCDPACVDVTLVGRLHSLTSIPQSIALPLAAIFGAGVFSQEPKWGQKWAALSFGLGMASMAAGPLMQIPALHIFVGLIQRLGMGFALAWIFVVSIKMLIETRAL